MAKEACLYGKRGKRGRLRLAYLTHGPVLVGERANEDLAVLLRKTRFFRVLRCASVSKEAYSCGNKGLSIWQMRPMEIGMLEVRVRVQIDLL